MDAYLTAYFGSAFAHEVQPEFLSKARGLPTYPALVGLEAARDRVAQLHVGAAQALSAHGWQHGPLARLADWLLGRRH